MKRKAIGEMEVLYILGIMLISPGSFFLFTGAYRRKVDESSTPSLSSSPALFLLIHNPRAATDTAHHIVYAIPT